MIRSILQNLSPQGALDPALLLVFAIGACLAGHSALAEPAGAARSGENRTPADTILNNGRIYTLDPEQPWAEALVIVGGKLVYVGAAAGAEAWSGPETRRHDLGGLMVMPGINDAHSHPVQGGVKTLYQCNFPFSASPEEVADALRGCIRRNPDQEWVVGGQWTSDFFRQHELPSPRKFLDAVSTEQVIFLHDDSGHNAWVNTARAGGGRYRPGHARSPRGDHCSRRGG